MLVSEHHHVMTLSAETWPGVLQMIQKHIKEMGFPVSDAYILPMNAEFLVGSVMANYCGSLCPMRISMVETSNQW